MSYVRLRRDPTVRWNSSVDVCSCSFHHPSAVSSCAAVSGPTRDRVPTLCPRVYAEIAAPTDCPSCLRLYLQIQSNNNSIFLEYDKKSGGLAYLVTSLVTSTKLINAGPGYYLDGSPSAGRQTILVCNQSPRSTQQGKRNEYQQKLRRKQAHCAMH